MDVDSTKTLSNGTSSPAVEGAETPEAAPLPKMDFFNSVLNPPDWLNEAYMEKVLRSYERDPQLKVVG